MKRKIKGGCFESEVQRPKSKLQSLKSKVRDSRFEIRDLGVKAKKVFRARAEFVRIVGVALIFSALLNFACVNKSLLKNNNVAAIVEENNLSQFERDLQTMKTANFDYIYAFRRRDTGVFDAEDKKYLRANTPPGTNRFVATDEERAFIAGSRYVFSPENLAALQKRFLVEDHSKSAEQPTAQNTNQNTNQNANANR